MNVAEFFARYQATNAALQAYVNGLPLWVNVWRGWMFVIFTAAVVFVIWKREARWLLLTMIISLFAYNLLAMCCGVGRFPSIALVLCWSPLAFYLKRRRSRLSMDGWFDTVYSWWLTTALATLCVSIGFDTYNVAYALVAHVP